jgi:hypothetical protein
VSTMDDARATLLRALEQLDLAAGELGGIPERVDLVVIYAMGRHEGEGGWGEVSGWAVTAGPDWVTAALLQRAADAHATTVYAEADDEE